MGFQIEYKGKQMPRHKAYKKITKSMAADEKKTYDKIYKVIQKRKKKERDMKSELLVMAWSKKYIMDNVHRADAGAKVAGIAELLSNILERLDVKSLAATRRVSRFFESQYQDNSNLRAMTFRPLLDSNAGKITSQDKQPLWNPFFFDSDGKIADTASKVLPDCFVFTPKIRGDESDKVTVEFGLDMNEFPALQSALEQSWAEYHFVRPGRAFVLEFEFAFWGALGPRVWSEMRLTVQGGNARSVFKIACALWKSIWEDGLLIGKLSRERDGGPMVVKNSEEETQTLLKAGGLEESEIALVKGGLVSKGDDLKMFYRMVGT